jgi:hypothetical protein
MIDFPDLTPAEVEMRAILSDPRKLQAFGRWARERWQKGRRDAERERSCGAVSRAGAEAAPGLPAQRRL